MTISLGSAELIELILGFAALLGAFGGLLLKLFTRQIDQRFDAQNEARREARDHTDNQLAELRQMSQENEKELLRLRAELPNEYVRREDWIRFGTVIDAKLDRLNTKIDGLTERRQ